MMRRIIAHLWISLDGVVEEPEDWHFPAGTDRLAAVAAGHPGHPPVAGAHRRPAETAADPQAPPYPTGATGLHTISVRVVPAFDASGGRAHPIPAIQRRVAEAQPSSGLPLAAWRPWRAAAVRRGDAMTMAPH
jgi:hypothetical protein